MLDWEPCTQEYLRDNFYPAEPRHKDQAQFHIQKLKCVNLHGSPLTLYGDMMTHGSSMLSIFFSSCDLLNIATCHDEAAVTEFLKHKYVLVYLTEERFNPESKGSEAYSTFYQIPVNRFVNTNHRF